MARRQDTQTYETPDGEVTITLTAMGAVEGGLLGIKLANIIGPSLAGIATAMEKDDSTGITSALTTFFQKVPPAEFRTLVRDLTKGAQAATGEEFVDVTEAWLNDNMGVGSLYKLLANGVRLNFKNFSKELGLSGDILTKLKMGALKAAGKVMQTETPKAGPAPQA